MFLHKYFNMYLFLSFYFIVEKISHGNDFLSNISGLKNRYSRKILPFRRSFIHTKDNDSSPFGFNYNSERSAFFYIVGNPVSDLYMTRKEIRTEKGITGHYEVKLPDGRIQTVHYEADGDGFKPVIKYRSSAPKHQNYPFISYDKPKDISSMKPKIPNTSKIRYVSSSSVENGENDSYFFKNSDRTGREPSILRKSDYVEESHLTPGIERYERRKLAIESVPQSSHPMTTKISEAKIASSNEFYTVQKNNSKTRTTFKKSSSSGYTTAGTTQRLKTGTSEEQNSHKEESSEKSETNIFQSKDKDVTNFDEKNIFSQHDENIFRKSFIPHVFKYRVYIPY